MTMSEAAFQKRITDLCDLLGVKWHHEVDSRKSKKGFPDLVLVGNRVIFAELKADKGTVTAEQRDWLDAVERAGGLSVVWRPQDWKYVEHTIRAIARLR